MLNRDNYEKRVLPKFLVSITYCSWKYRVLSRVKTYVILAGQPMLYKRARAYADTHEIEIYDTVMTIIVPSIFVHTALIYVCRRLYFMRRHAEIREYRSILDPESYVQTDDPQSKGHYRARDRRSLSLSPALIWIISIWDANGGEKVNTVIKY